MWLYILGGASLVLVCLGAREIWDALNDDRHFWGF